MNHILYQVFDILLSISSKKKKKKKEKEHETLTDNSPIKGYINNSPVKI